ncbi:hypothetical protein [Polaribacter sp. MED152]|uniref:hypothetical protein n=1 Tax=Polaribacter sp. MED152 TaxID=313598 RepID=UPI000068C631|nr:hypothetical protein [Polaribacter sp. MED152]EAQ42867.1 hypothetical protein MED152_09095 [Polaribacter sp. MED152]
MKKTTILFLILCCSYTFSQNKLNGKDLKNAYDKYTNSYQEVVFAHLNKDKLIQGEALGFTAYVLHKQSKKPSELTKNLYCVIEDENKNIVRKKLYKVENGIANGIFNIDSKFKGGNYTFKAYTNYMLNFTDQQNYYSSNFQVLDVTLDINIAKINRSKSLDVQLLPESGHYLHNTSNTVGVVVKDSLGYGVANLKGQIITNENKTVSSFALNHLGIGRFLFTPDITESYTIVLKEKNKIILEKSYRPNVKINGIILKVGYNGENCIVSVKTNAETLPKITNKKFVLSIHDGKQLNHLDIVFNDKPELTKKIPFSYMAKGINVITLLSDKNIPIAERLFFNYHNLNILKSKVTLEQKRDTASSISLNYSKFRESQFNNVSISILPLQTKSYNKNTNIISQTLLLPYIKGIIEKSGYYFKEINKKTKYDLDNLLITQGWSSYNWSNIFNNNNIKRFNFERGISLKINIPKKEKATRFYLHNTSQTRPESFELNKGVKTFIYDNFYPKDKEPIYFSKINKKGEASTIGLYVQYFPSIIPTLNKDANRLRLKKEYFTIEEDTENFSYLNLNRTQILDEIEIKTSLEDMRRNSIKNATRGEVFFIEERDRETTLADYLNDIPYVFAEEDFIKKTFRSFNRNNGEPYTMVVDGVEKRQRELHNFLLDYIDFIDIDPYNRSYGDIMSMGAIKITTHPERYKATIKQTKSKFNVPLGFTASKTFYKPLYPTYKDSFFKEFGVIDWLPINEIDSNGNLSFSFWNNQPNSYKLFIEGVTADGDFIFEEKIISMIK